MDICAEVETLYADMVNLSIKDPAHNIQVFELGCRNLSFRLIHGSNIPWDIKYFCLEPCNSVPYLSFDLGYRVQTTIDLGGMLY